jgi:hypothetical protein
VLTSNQRAELLGGNMPGAMSPAVLLQRDRLAFWPADDVAGTSHTIFDHHHNRNLLNAGLTIGSDWLEGTGAGYAQGQYHHLDDFSSAWPFSISAEIYVPSLSATFVPIASVWHDDGVTGRSWALGVDNAAAKSLHSTNGGARRDLRTL